MDGWNCGRNELDSDLWTDRIQSTNSWNNNHHDSYKRDHPELDTVDNVRHLHLLRLQSYDSKFAIGKYIHDIAILFKPIGNVQQLSDRFIVSFMGMDSKFTHLPCNWI
jgi:hypothetical protein